MGKHVKSFMTENRKAYGRSISVLALLGLCAAGVFFFLFMLRPRPLSAQSPVKLWSIDLGADKDFHKRLSILEVSLDPPFINFLNGSEILCDFYDEGKVGFNPSLTRHGYHVLEIDARTGAFGRKLDFQSVDDHSRAFPVADGGFVVLAGEELKKFSPGFAPGPNFATPIESPDHRPDLWLMDVAPSGHTLLLYHQRVGEKQGNWTWMRTTDLTSLSAVQGPLARTIKASDAAGIGGIIDAELFSPGKTTVICDRCVANFLTSDLLFLDEEHEYSIETTVGKKLASGGLDVQALNFNRSAQTTRFAYSTGHYIGSGFPIQANFNTIAGKIMVSDWSTNKPIAEIDVNEPAGNPSAGFTQMALALSPDGKYLAVLLHHTLSLYRLP
jgi:hypothetical protein